jgi:polar amino acid transport system permease protein
LRGAWASLPREHIDAGQAFGFSGWQLYRRIILPPILMACVPVLGNQIIQIIKDSAFLTIIAVPELTHEASAIQSMYYVPFAAFVSAVVLYWLLCRIVEMLVGLIERRAEKRR